MSEGKASASRKAIPYKAKPAMGIDLPAAAKEETKNYKPNKNEGMLSNFGRSHCDSAKCWRHTMTC